MFEFYPFVELSLLRRTLRSDPFNIDILLVDSKPLPVHKAADEFIFIKVCYRGRVHTI